MIVLVGCEESQAVTKAFRKLGIEAYSNDLQLCSGGHSEWHLQMDVFEAIKLVKPTLGIFHPTCTYLTNSGVCWLYNKDGSRNEDRWDKMKEGALFFKRLLEADIPHILVENPIPHKYAVEIIGRKYDQLIQPYMFGHPESKATCFWLKNLPKLISTKDVKELYKSLPKSEAQKMHYLSPGPERAKLRSKTYEGIADAIANQYSKFILK